MEIRSHILCPAGALILIILCIVQVNAIARSDSYQNVTVDSVRLSTSATAQMNEDFFFHTYMNLTMREWIDQSGIQRPGVVDGPLLKTSYNTLGLVFDGIDDAATVPNSKSLNPMNELTIEMWVQFSSYGGSARAGRDWFTLLSKGSYWGSASYCLLFAANTTDRSILFLINGTRVASARTFAGNYAWYHIVATFGGSIATIFLNGELVASVPFHGNLTDNNDDLYIGCEKDDIYPLNGVVGALRIYNKTLNPDEIKLLYQRKTLNNTGSLVLDLNLNNLEFFFEESDDGLNFHDVFQSGIDETTFAWTENQSGRYFYRIVMPLIENNTRITSYSNICVVDVSQAQVASRTFLVKPLCACLLVLTSIIGLFYSRKKQRCKA